MSKRADIFRTTNDVIPVNHTHTNSDSVHRQPVCLSVCLSMCVYLSFSVFVTMVRFSVTNSTNSLLSRILRHGSTSARSAVRTRGMDPQLALSHQIKLSNEIKQRFSLTNIHTDVSSSMISSPHGSSIILVSGISSPSQNSKGVTHERGR